MFKTKPANTDNRQSEIDAAEAEQLLRHRMIEGFFAEAESRIAKAIMAVPVNDKVAREDLHYRAHYLAKFKGWFEAYIRAGKLPPMVSEMPTINRIFRKR
jgi:hypothetical protein